MKIMKMAENLGTGYAAKTYAYPSGNTMDEEVREPTMRMVYHNMAELGDDPFQGESQGTLEAIYPGKTVRRRYAPVNEEGPNWGQAWAIVNDIGENEQLPLFTDTAEGYQGNPYVQKFKGTRGGRVGNMTMLGVAELDAQKRGTTLSTDYSSSEHSLSPHSSRLVEKLTGESVPVTNDWDFQDETNEVDFSWINDYAGKEVSYVPDKDVRAGRSLIRGTVRGRNLSKQFDEHNYEQLQIPGV